MQKRSVSGSSGGSGSAVDAMTALTAAVQELQAAMSVFAGLLQQQGAGAVVSNAATGQPVADMSSTSSTSYPGSPEDAADAVARFDEQTIQEFDIPNARLRGAIDRAESIPYDPSNIFALEQQRAALDERERQRLLAHGEQLRAAGELSPDEELKLTEETEHLATDETRASSAISRGVRMEDYLPALSANRPAGVWEGRGNGGNWGNEGTATWEEGRGDAAGEFLPARTNETMTTERLAEAIGRLADAILNGNGRSGSALHPGEAQGGLNGLLQSARLSARPDGYN